MSCKLEVSIPFRIEYSVFLCNSETKIFLRVSYVMIHVYPTTFPACFQLMGNLYIDFFWMKYVMFLVVQKLKLLKLGISYL